MGIQDTLIASTKALSENNIPHALIGGMALAAHGVVRATVDIDLLVDGDMKESARKALIEAGFNVVNETSEVLQFSGLGQLDILVANRALSKQMLKNARTLSDFPVPVVLAEDLIGLKIQAYTNDSSREFQDKADIQSLISNCKNLDFDKIKEYADLFQEWNFITSLRGQK